MFCVALEFRFSKKCQILWIGEILNTNTNNKRPKTTLSDLNTLTLIVAAALAKLHNTLFFHEKRSH